jgi:ADP-dependent NAD(P)H-hydrate dehydratase / NAD(P)H-hydrate epimerase
VTIRHFPVARVPTLDSSALRAIDAAAERDYGLDTLQLMEVAGFQVARTAADLLDTVLGKRVVIAAGGGNNGGDALAAARFLFQRGADIQVWMRPSQRLSPLTAHHRLTMERLGIRMHDADRDPLPAGDLVLDGLLGTGIQLPLRSDVARLIQTINESGMPVLAVDIPSGLDGDTGAGRKDCIQADWTVTLGLTKPALGAGPPVGRVFLADIGIPLPLFGQLAEAVRDVYAAGDLLELVAGR